VLIYNLVNLAFPSESLSAASVCNDSRILSAVLRCWRKEIAYGGTTPDELIYMLEHKYTNASLKLNALKGADLLKARFLKDVCAQTGFGFFLASLERMVAGSAEESDDDRRYSYRRYRPCGYRRHCCDYDDEDENGGDGYRGGYFHTIEEEFERVLKLTRVVDLEGNEVGRDFNIEEENIVQEQPFEDRDPDQEDYQGYTGNAGASATHWYRDTVIVLMPREKYMDFLLRPFRRGLSWDLHNTGLDICGLMRTVLQNFTSNPYDSNAGNDLHQICQFAVEEQNQGRNFPNALYGMVVNASRFLRQPDLLLRAALCVKKLPMDTFPYIGALIRQFGFPTLHTG
jgi:hypothetical protein